MLAGLQVTTPTCKQRRQLGFKPGWIMVVYLASGKIWRFNSASPDVKLFSKDSAAPKSASATLKRAFAEALQLLEDGTGFV